ncbi:cation transporter [Umezawaea sp.]|uniref:cation transporter n=1 Tax=Umezawaea sp. TaxID=1955258 RepID=UPI002ED2373E
MAAVYGRYEPPADKADLHRRAVRLEWWTIGFFVAAITLLAVTLGQSQAMEAAWVEDILALTPPVAFLIANRYRNRAPSPEHPYGHHRSVAIAFLASALSLLVLGGYVLVDSVIRLVEGERPPIGLVEVFDVTVWLGWPMIAVLLLTMVPAILLGRAKIGLAEELHDKVLYADAEMNRAPTGSPRPPPSSASWASARACGGPTPSRRSSSPRTSSATACAPPAPP